MITAAQRHEVSRLFGSEPLVGQVMQVPRAHRPSPTAHQADRWGTREGDPPRIPVPSFVLPRLGVHVRRIDGAPRDPVRRPPATPTWRAHAGSPSQDRSVRPEVVGNPCDPPTAPTSGPWEGPTAAGARRYRTAGCAAG